MDMLFSLTILYIMSIYSKLVIHLLNICIVHIDNVIRRSTVLLLSLIIWFQRKEEHCVIIQDKFTLTKFLENDIATLVYRYTALCYSVFNVHKISYVETVLQLSYS